MGTIALAYRPAGDRLDHEVVLLFAAGQRPCVDEIRTLSGIEGQFAVTLEGHNNDDGTDWVELLANGLTFDLTGLAPGKGMGVPDTGHVYGFPRRPDSGEWEALTLAPGPHLTSGGTMVPVLRALAWLAAQLSSLPSLRAIVWCPARTMCAPDYYRDAVMGWISGGAFPGFGLTALILQPDGALLSEGLALFTGQELRLDAALAEDKPGGAKVALRLLHWLVENGRVDHTMSLTGPAGDTLILEPDREAGLIRVVRG